MKRFFYQFYSILEPSQRKIAVWLLCAMVLGAVLEALGVGLMLPLFGLISKSHNSLAEKGTMVAYMIKAFHLRSFREVVLFYSLSLFVIFLSKNVYLALMYQAQFGYVFSNQVRLAKRLFHAYMFSPYVYHLNHNSAELLRNVNEEVRLVFNNVMIPVYIALVELMVMMMMGLVLLVFQPVITLLVVIVFGGISAIFYRLVQKKNAEYGELKQKHALLMIKTVNQGLGAIKEVKVLGVENYFVNSYHESSSKYADSMKFQSVVASMPRFFIESVGFGGILMILVLVTLREKDPGQVLPVIALFAMVAVRLMPSLTRVIASLTTIRQFKPALDVVYNTLEVLKQTPRHQLEQGSDSIVNSRDLHFENEIKIQDVWYTYPGAEQAALKGVELVIKRGQSVAFVGPSGAGKTTLVDLLLGLIVPDSGKVWIDKEEMSANLPCWRKKIGYIAQPTFLLDDSVRRNVALGIPDTDIVDMRVWEALEMAQLGAFVKELPDGLDTRMGEFGVRFSGGQRQRIGIARALYNDPEILVLDEATSALDNQTEKEITNSITKLQGKKTILIIAHRLSTVEHCDTLFFLKNGQMKMAAPYTEMLKNNDEFREMALVSDSE
jgi:ATP-binding cassette, subfamily B, bacterial PglK